MVLRNLVGDRSLRSNRSSVRSARTAASNESSSFRNSEDPKQAKVKRWPSFNLRAKKKEKKKVAFAGEDSYDIHYTWTRKEISKAEAVAYWIGDKELQRMIDRCWDIVDMHEDHDKSQPFDLCTRGLENYIIERRKGKRGHRMQRQKGFQAVLSWGKGMSDEEVARRYKSATHESKLKAIEFGRRDEAIARRILADLRKKYKGKRTRTQSPRSRQAPGRTKSSSAALPSRKAQSPRSNQNSPKGRPPRRNNSGLPGGRPVNRKPPRRIHSSTGNLPSRRPPPRHNSTPSDPRAGSADTVPMIISFSMDEDADGPVEMDDVSVLGMNDGPGRRRRGPPPGHRGSPVKLTRKAIEERKNKSKEPKPIEEPVEEESEDEDIEEGESNDSSESNDDSDEESEASDDSGENDDNDSSDDEQEASIDDREETIQEEDSQDVEEENTMEGSASRSDLEDWNTDGSDDDSSSDSESEESDSSPESKDSETDSEEIESTADTSGEEE